MDWGSVLNYAAVLLALLSAGGLGLQRSRVSGLKGDLDDARKRVEDLRGDLSDAEKDRAKDKARIATLETQLDYANRLATGEQHWSDLDKHLNEHHTEAKAAWTDIQRKIDRLAK